MLLIFSFLVSCQTEEVVSAQDIVDKAIAYAGGQRYYKSKIEFDFRNRNYCAIRGYTDFKLERQTIEDSVVTTDILSNSYFIRLENEEQIALSDSIKTNLANAVNSVHYFSVLPYGLNDSAANKTYLGKVKVKGQNYHKIEVTFSKEGGGTDFDDVFIYWIHTENFYVDYLAYKFHVNGGGMRFREAYNGRKINGIRFVDYKNYKPISKEIKLVNLDKGFESNNLELLSNIELENVKVEDCISC